MTPTDNVQQNVMTAEDLKQKCIDSYAIFCLFMQDDGYYDDVHKDLCQWAQHEVERAEKEVEDTGECELELGFIMPRGSLKSTIVTKLFTAWITVRRFYKFNDSSTRTLIAGNTFNNASAKMYNDLGGLFKTHDLFVKLFPEILPTGGDDGKWNQKGMNINRTGSFPETTFECAGTNTKLIGRHYNGIIEDDTTAPDVSDYEDGITLPSQSVIEQAIGFHQAATSLFVPKGFTFHLVVSTRWASQDLINYVSTKGKFRIFSKAAYDDLGQPNFSCFYSAAKLEKIRDKVGDFMFSMLYLNKPLDNSLRVFNPEHFHHVPSTKVPNRGYFTICVDPAISTEDSACESSITVNQHVNRGHEKHEYWWEDINVKMLPFELANRILDVAERYTKEFPRLNGGKPVKAIVVETVAYQMALKSILENEMLRRGLKFNIEGVNTKSNKDLRIRSMEPPMKQGRIHFVRTSEDPKKNRLSLQTESQLVQYPHGALVDTIDSWSMHRKYVRKDKRDMGYGDEVTEEMAQGDDFLSAKLEIQARNKKRGVGVLEAPTAIMGQGLGMYSSSRGGTL